MPCNSLETRYLLPFSCKNYYNETLCKVNNRCFISIFEYGYVQAQLAKLPKNLLAKASLTKSTGQVCMLWCRIYDDINKDLCVLCIFFHFF